MCQINTMHTDSAYGSLTSLVIEPLPFHRKYDGLSESAQYATDPFFQSVLELLLTMDAKTPEPVAMSSAWPQLTTIAIPTKNTLDMMTDDGFTTPDDHRPQQTAQAIAMSPGGGSRKRLRVETIHEKTIGSTDDSEEEDFRKRLLTNTRRDAVAQLREEARALETTLKGLHLRQSRPKSELISDDPDALVKSYAENIQLKRAIEEQDAKIKTLRRAVSQRESELGTEPGKTLLSLQLS